MLILVLWFYFKPTIKGKGLVLPGIALKQGKRAYLKKKCARQTEKIKKMWVEVNYFCNRPR